MLYEDDGLQRNSAGLRSSPSRRKPPTMVIKAQDRHLKDVVAGGDDAHEPASKEMQASVEATRVRRWAWYKEAPSVISLRLAGRLTSADLRSPRRRPEPHQTERR